MEIEHSVVLFGKNSAVFLSVLFLFYFIFF